MGEVHEGGEGSHWFVVPSMMMMIMMTILRPLTFMMEAWVNSA
jgi:hypothetical protein